MTGQPEEPPECGVFGVWAPGEGSRQASPTTASPRCSTTWLEGSQIASLADGSWSAGVHSRPGRPGFRRTTACTAGTHVAVGRRFSTTSFHPRGGTRPNGLPQHRSRAPGCLGAGGNLVNTAELALAGRKTSLITTTRRAPPPPTPTSSGALLAGGSGLQHRQAAWNSCRGCGAFCLAFMDEFTLYAAATPTVCSRCHSAARPGLGVASGFRRAGTSAASFDPRHRTSELLTITTPTASLPAGSPARPGAAISNYVSGAPGRRHRRTVGAPPRVGIGRQRPEIPVDAPT